jgi:sterol desaturase/sphingolipid hydroxylase (fatty acid hydroxylase superfamily)
VEKLLEQGMEMVWALAIFALAAPVEAMLGTGAKSSMAERLGNVGAMLVNFVAGGLLLNAILATPEAASLLEFPPEPRFAAVAHPVAWALVATFLVDGIYYVYHRLQHSVPLLWHIHALHHTDPAMNVTTAKRTHFLERPIQFLLLVLPVLWLLGYNEGGSAILAVTGPFLLYFAHVDVKVSLGPLTPLVVGPQYHRLHHALDAHEQGTNFAQAFPLFDMIGGTYRRPRHDEYVATGTEGCDTAASRWQPILW